MHGASISCQNTLLGASIPVIFPHTFKAELYPLLSQISLPWQPELVVVEFV